MSRFSWAALMAAGLVIPAPAADPVPPVAPAVLLEKLGSGLFAERENASRDLLKLGPTVLPLVEAAAKTSPDAEVRTRAARLAEALRCETDSAKIVKTRTVKLDYTQIPLGTLISDIKSKTGINLVLDPDRVANPLRLVTVKVPGDVPAWEAVEEVCKAAGLVEVFKHEIPAPQKKSRNEYEYYTPYGPRVDPPPAHEVAVTLADGTYKPIPGSRATAVRVLALPAGFPGSKIVLGAGQAIISLDVTPLPSVNWLDVLSVHVHKAEDETGRPVMTCQRPINSMMYDPYSGMMWGGGIFWGGDVMYENRKPVSVINPRVVPVVLKTDDRGSKELKVLEGVVLGDATLKDAPVVVVEDLKNALNQTMGGSLGTQLTVTHFDKEKNGAWKLRVRIERVPQSTFLAMRRGRMNQNMMWGWGGMVESSGRNGLLDSLKFFDAAGKDVKKPSGGPTNTMFDGMKQTEECDFTFAAGVNPVRMVMTGTKLVTVEIPFKLEHVKLP